MTHGLSFVQIYGISRADAIIAFEKIKTMEEPV